VLVSVVIPTYNAGKYLREAIDSALNQTYKDVEVIVSNDASTDNTKVIMEEYHDRIIQIDSPVNKGTARALNLGIKNAKGDWIKWLSADDVLLPQAIESMLWCMTPEYDDNTIFYTNYHIIDQNGRHLRDFVEPKTPPDLWDKFYGNGSTSMIHRNVFEKCGMFDESLRFGEDYEFWLRCTQIYGVKLHLLPIFTINYRNHPEQLTHKVGGGNDRQIKDSIMQRIPQK